MMFRTTIMTHRPQVAADEYGREPTIWEMIVHYYASHGCEDPEGLAHEYVDTLIREQRR